MTTKKSKQYWLMKSEPDVYPITKLKKENTSLWDGVRNYQARNFMMNDMKVGDEVLFYHSNAKPSGIAGLARVSGKAVPDPSQFKKSSEYYEKRATKEKPVWYCVEVKFVKEFKNLVSLEELKENDFFGDMLVTKKGQRLSIQPVEKKHFDKIKKLGQERRNQ